MIMRVVLDGRNPLCRRLGWMTNNIFFDIWTHDNVAEVVGCSPCVIEAVGRI
jgi:hypothetical protein